MSVSRPGFVRLWGPAILWGIIIFIVSTIETPSIHPPRFFIPWDKVAHFFFYACFALFVIRPLRHGTPPMALVPAGLLAFLAVSGYGIIIEGYQTLVDRKMEIADAIADMAGAAAASSIYLLAALNGKRARRKQSGQQKRQGEN
jgi:VanZ family protein